MFLTFPKAWHWALMPKNQTSRAGSNFNRCLTYLRTFASQVQGGFWWLLHSNNPGLRQACPSVSESFPLCLGEEPNSPDLHRTSPHWIIEKLGAPEICGSYPWTCTVLHHDWWFKSEMVQDGARSWGSHGTNIIQYRKMSPCSLVAPRSGSEQ